MRLGPAPTPLKNPPRVREGLAEPRPSGIGTQSLKADTPRRTQDLDPRSRDTHGAVNAKEEAGSGYAA